MMHLAANTPGPRSWPCGTNRSDRLASASCLRRRAARFPAPRQARSVSRKQSTNFLEFIDAGFHYSVFARDNAAGAAAGLSLKWRSAARTIGGGEPGPACTGKIMDGASTRTRRFRFRSGDRKIDANASELGCSDDGGGCIRDARAMRLGKNINAKLPSYATIAPILHAKLQVTPTQRGITLNTGAADADGR